MVNNSLYKSANPIDIIPVKFSFEISRYSKLDHFLLLLLSQVNSFISIHSSAKVIFSQYNPYYQTLNITGLLYYPTQKIEENGKAIFDIYPDRQCSDSEIHNCIGKGDKFYPVDRASSYEFRVHGENFHSTDVDLSRYPSSIPLAIIGMETKIDFFIHCSNEFYSLSIQNILLDSFYGSQNHILNLHIFDNSSIYHWGYFYPKKSFSS